MLYDYNRNNFESATYPRLEHFNLFLQDGVGTRTALHFDTIDDEISRLKDNFEVMSESIEFKTHDASASMKASKSHSDQFSKESTPGKVKNI